MHLLFNNLMMAEDSGSGGGSDDSSLETFELLNEETPEPEEVLEIGKTDKSSGKSIGDEDEEDTDETETEEEVDELKEIEEELKGPKEEDLELTTPVRRKEILAKYPQLFKDFPYLEKAYYREQQFTELLPTIQDARIAVDKAKAIDHLERSIMGGDISDVLQAAKQESQEVFYKIADNYLPALKKVDQQAYYHVLGNVVKDTIITMVREGRNLGEQGAPLTAAANILNQFVFGSQNFTPAQTLARRENPEDQSRQEAIRQQEQRHVYGRFETTRDELQSKADNVLRSTIDQHIDPNGAMTDYVKKNAMKDAQETLESLMDKDTRFRGIIDKLWEKAFQQNFNKESTDRIKSAYLSKAKTLLPSVIKKARNDALKGLGRKAESKLDFGEIEPATKKGPIQSGKSTAPSSGKIRSGKDIPKHMSTLDVLNS